MESRFGVLGDLDHISFLFRGVFVTALGASSVKADPSGFCEGRSWVRFDRKPLRVSGSL